MVELLRMRNDAYIEIVSEMVYMDVSEIVRIKNMLLSAMPLVVRCRTLNCDCPTVDARQTRAARGGDRIRVAAADDG